MVTIPRPRIVRRSADLEAEDLPEQVTIAVRDLAGAVKQGLLALSVGVGLAVVRELFEAEVTRLAGAKGKHDPNRRALSTWPRVSAGDTRWPARSRGQTPMPAGLSTRRYPAGLEPIGEVE